MPIKIMPTQKIKNSSNEYFLSENKVFTGQVLSVLSNKIQTCYKWYKNRKNPWLALQPNTSFFIITKQCNLIRGNHYLGDGCLKE